MTRQSRNEAKFKSQLNKGDHKKQNRFANAQASKPEHKNTDLDRATQSFFATLVSHWQQLSSAKKALLLSLAPVIIYFLARSFASASAKQDGTANNLVGLVSSMLNSKPRDASTHYVKESALNEAIRNVAIKKFYLRIPGDSKSINIAEPTEAEVLAIHRALKGVCNKSSLKALEKGIIIIAPEDYIHSRVGLPEFDAFFETGVFEGGAVYLNSYLFDGKPERGEQLLTRMANEFSHKETYTRHAQLKTDRSSVYNLLAPWKDNAQKIKIMRAHEKFENRIKQYQNLADKKPNQLSPQDRDLLQKYDAAMENYTPVREGRLGYNTMQQTVSLGDGRFSIEANPKNTISQDKQERIRYLRTNLFRKRAIKKALEERPDAFTGTLYDNQRQQDLLRKFADYISDFDELNPEVRRIFGPELCDYLNEFRDVDDHCDRPNWDNSNSKF